MAEHQEDNSVQSGSSGDKPKPAKVRSEYRFHADIETRNHNVVRSEADYYFRDERSPGQTTTRFRWILPVLLIVIILLLIYLLN